MLADVWEVETQAGACGEYVSPFPRLFVVLNEAADGMIRLADSAAQGGSPATGKLSFIPAGTRTWSVVERPGRLHHLDLHFDADRLSAAFGHSLDRDRLASPRLMFDNAAIHALACLLAQDCAGEGLHALYGESLALAMLTSLFDIAGASADRRSRLSPRRLRMATDYLASHCLEAVRLVDLAQQLELSPSYFSSAFKASTGLTPHQWQMKERIERVKALLLASRTALSDVAGATGFADQAHMTRVFKQYVGMTPAAWLRANA